jgi:hypothetical protein
LCNYGWEPTEPESDDYNSGIYCTPCSGKFSDGTQCKYCEPGERWSGPNSYILNKQIENINIVDGCVSCGSNTWGDGLGEVCYNCPDGTQCPNGCKSSNECTPIPKKSCNWWCKFKSQPPWEIALEVAAVVVVGVVLIVVVGPELAVAAGIGAESGAYVAATEMIELGGESIYLFGEGAEVAEGAYGAVEGAEVAGGVEGAEGAAEVGNPSILSRSWARISGFGKALVRDIRWLGKIKRD